MLFLTHPRFPRWLVTRVIADYWSARVVFFLFTRHVLATVEVGAGGGWWPRTSILGFRQRNLRQRIEIPDQVPSCGFDDKNDSVAPIRNLMSWVLALEPDRDCLFWNTKPAILISVGKKIVSRFFVYTFFWGGGGDRGSPAQFAVLVTITRVSW